MTYHLFYVRACALAKFSLFDVSKFYFGSRVSEVQHSSIVVMEQIRAISELSSEELCNYLSGQVHQTAALDKLKEHDINGQIFVNLTEDDLKDLFPNIGQRLSIATVLRQLKKKTENSQSNSKSKVNYLILTTM